MTIPPAPRSAPDSAPLSKQRAPLQHTTPGPRPRRTYTVTAQGLDGAVRTFETIAPALPLFDAAVSAIARGTLISTTRGPVAVEDLVPGMRLLTAERGPSPLLWIGSATLTPEAGSLVPRKPWLTRIMAEAFGMGRPLCDVLAGPGARLLSRQAGIEENTGGRRVLTPAHEMADGFGVIPVAPPAPVTVYHLGLRRHGTITAAGLEMETFHPGPGFERGLDAQQLAQFLSLFPHIRTPADFGTLAHLRLPLVTPHGRELA